MNVAPSASSGRRVIARTTALLFDVLIVAVVVVLVGVVLTGGGVFHISEFRIRARSVDNPVWILTVLIALRSAVERSLAHRGRVTWFSAFVRGGASVVASAPSILQRAFERPIASLAAIGAATFFIKVLIAWTSPGFFSGDDVEVQEMSIGALLGLQWSVWELRSAFFPLTFVYPAQWIANVAGASTPDALVLAGRTSVALLSTAALPLTWLAARRLAPAEPHVAAVSVMLVAINKLFVSFGSSELPRPVSTVFVIGAFTLLLRAGLAAAIGAGVLLGCAIAFRFSEVVFVVAAMLPLALMRRWLEAACVGIVALTCAAMITAIADTLYWGSPLSSVMAAVDYTLVQGRSSRGYEPAWEYVRIIPAWSTPVVVALALAGSSRRHPDSWWLWTPIIVLSLLPHKESRYLIPVVPFLSISAARGFFRVITWSLAGIAGSRSRRWTLELLPPLIALSLLHDAGGWRLRRANQGIELAHHLRVLGGSGIAAEDFWTLGGRPYLWQQEPLLNLDAAILSDRVLAEAAVADKHWVVLHPGSATAGGDILMRSLGFTRDASWTGEEYVLYGRRR